MSRKDTELVCRAKNGDLHAFEELITIYQSKVYTMCLRMCGNADDALDLAQEALIRVYKALPMFKEQSSFSTWVYSITSNVCIDFIRKQKKRKTVPLFSTDEEGEETVREIPDSRYQPDSEYEKNTDPTESVTLGETAGTIGEPSVHCPDYPDGTEVFRTDHEDILAVKSGDSVIYYRRLPVRKD